LLEPVVVVVAGVDSTVSEVPPFCVPVAPGVVAEGCEGGLRGSEKYQAKTVRFHRLFPSLCFLFRVIVDNEFESHVQFCDNY